MNKSPVVWGLAGLVWLAQIAVAHAAAPACDSRAGADAAPAPQQRLEIIGVGAPTAIPFIAENYNLAGIEAALFAAEVDVPGTIVAGELIFGLHHFEPSTPLEPGTYLLRLTVDGFDTEGSVRVLARDTVDLDLAADTFSASEQRDETNCCRSEQGGCPSQSCWGTQFSSSRLVGGSVTVEDPFILAASIVDGEFPGAPRLVYPDAAPFSVGGGDIEADEICIELTAWEFDGRELATHEECFPASEFPEPTLLNEDAEAQIKQCIDPPADPNDPLWLTHGTKKQGNTEAGCAAASGARPSAWPLLSFLLVVSMRRRRAS